MKTQRPRFFKVLLGQLLKLVMPAFLYNHRQRCEGGNTMDSNVSVVSYVSSHRAAIRPMLERIGWAEQYIHAAEHNADAFSAKPDEYGVYCAVIDGQAIGFVYVQFYEWNRLAQIQFLAVDPNWRRQGIALALVTRAEEFARAKSARGIYVDTPTLNLGGCAFYEAAGYNRAYVMPRYYEDALDGVTFQRFFGEVRSN
jgi:ribosomal-protein-alanine N-acetyltransferase